MTYIHGEKPKIANAPSVGSSDVVLRHVWLIQYANADGISHHHQTIYEHEVRSMAEAALEHEAVSLNIIRTQVEMPQNGEISDRRESATLKAPKRD